MDDPLEVFSMIVEGLWSELDDIKPYTIAWAVIVQELVLWGIARQTAFRVENFSHLTYFDEPKSALAKVQGEWRIWLKRELFKNFDGPYFVANGIERDFRRTLDDLDGFYQALDLFLLVARPILMQGQKHNALLVNSKTGAPLDVGGIQQGMTKTQERHLCYNPGKGSGIKGVQSCGPQWIRHVIPTGVLKATHDPFKAAAAIHDSVAMVLENYVCYLPDEFNQELRDVFRKSAEKTTTQDNLSSERSYRTNILLAQALVGLNSKKWASRGNSRI